jgi:NNP family nitrate/nitrite transporter-like MFS transporter
MASRTVAGTALIVSTVAFTLCFAAWVINAVLITYLTSHGLYAFDEGQIGWLLAMPILTGAISRVPLGLLTDRFGGRMVFTLLMLAVAAALYALGYADSYAQFLAASLAFGLAGGSFAVGVGYVALWFDRARQGTALGIFGMGNAGAAATTLLAPHLLEYYTQHGANLEGWRLLPKTYALVMLVVAGIFYFTTQDRRVEAAQRRSLTAQLAPLKDIVVWRFGLYYFLVFGSFVALAQWIVPYSVNVYQMSLAQAGMLAALFSLPSGVIRAAGGWLSDRFGARSVMYGVFLSCILACLLLSFPRMDITSPGEGVMARSAGRVDAVSAKQIVVGDKDYGLIPAPATTPAQLDTGDQMLPQVMRWHVPVVEEGEVVEKKELLARGVTNIYYPANLWIFAALVLVVGVATGIGKAGVYKFIPEQFPGAIGAVGGMVGLLGALGGFVFPPVWGMLLKTTGLWSSCWVVLAVISVACLLALHTVVRRIEREQAPDLAQLIEQRPVLALPHAVSLANGTEAKSVETILRRVPFFSALSDEELKELTQTGRVATYAPGETMFREGDPGEELFVILDGRVNVRRSSERGQLGHIATLDAGQFFGELALIDGKPRSAEVEAATHCECFVMGRSEFLRAVSRSPHMLADLLLGLSTRLRSGVERYAPDDQRLADT